MQRVAATRVAGAAAKAAAAAAAAKPAREAQRVMRPAALSSFALRRSKARRSVEAVSSDEEFETTISPDGSSWIVPKPEPAPLSEEEQAVASAAFEAAAELAQDPALQRLVLERLGPRVQRNLTMAAAAPAAPAAAGDAGGRRRRRRRGLGPPILARRLQLRRAPRRRVVERRVVLRRRLRALRGDHRRRRRHRRGRERRGGVGVGAAFSSAAPSVAAPADEKEGEEEARGVPAGTAVAAVVLGITVGLITCALLTRLNPAAGKAVARRRTLPSRRPSRARAAPSEGARAAVA